MVKPKIVAYTPLAVGIALTTLLSGCGTVQPSGAEGAQITTTAWYYKGPDGLTYNKPNPNPSPRDQVDPRTCASADGHTDNSVVLTCRSSALVAGPGGSLSTRDSTVPAPTTTPAPTATSPPTTTEAPATTEAPITTISRRTPCSSSVVGRSTRAADPRKRPRCVRDGAAPNDGYRAGRSQELRISSRAGEIS